MRDELEDNSRSILLVGHMPHLLQLLRVLCGDPPDSAASDFPMHGCIELEHQGELEA